MSQRRAVFLDRDGVINVNRSDHVKSWDEFVFLPRVFEALRQLAASPFAIVVTTNQAAIARGLTTEAVVRDIHRQMLETIHQNGGRIDAVCYCPHHPDAQCDCRKPQPGMYLRAAQEFDLDLAHSIVVGDALADLQAAHAIGAQAILVLTGRGQEYHAEMLAQNLQATVVNDLADAVEWIERAEKFSK